MKHAASQPPSAPSAPEGAQNSAESDILDVHSLHEAVRVVQHVIADRIPQVVEITEQEVLIVGKAVNDVVDAARAQVTESREILAQVDENSGIAVTIERLATAMEAFLAKLNPYLTRQEVVSSTAARYGAKIEEAGHKIDTIALAANILNLNAQIEAARLGEVGEPFMIIASEMTTLTRQIEEANGMIAELSNTLLSTLPEIAAINGSISNTCADFGSDFSKQVTEVRDVQHLLQASVRASLESTESRAEQMLRISQDALSHLQFQDPVAQSLWQVQLGLSALANMVGANLPAYQDVERHHAGTSTGHNPLHALASQYGLKLLHGNPSTNEAPSLGVVQAGEDSAEDEESPESGDVLLF